MLVQVDEAKALYLIDSTGLELSATNIAKNTSKPLQKVRNTCDGLVDRGLLAKDQKYNEVFYSLTAEGKDALENSMTT